MLIYQNFESHEKNVLLHINIHRIDKIKEIELKESHLEIQKTFRY